MSTKTTFANHQGGQKEIVFIVEGASLLVLQLSVKKWTQPIVEEGKMDCFSQIGLYMDLV